MSSHFRQFVRCPLKTFIPTQFIINVRKVFAKSFDGLILHSRRECFEQFCNCLNSLIFYR